GGGREVVDSGRGRACGGLRGLPLRTRRTRGRRRLRRLGRSRRGLLGCGLLRRGRLRGGLPARAAGRLRRLLLLVHGFVRPQPFVTSTRWRTFRIIPRIAGESSRTTFSPRRPKPRPTRVAFWSFGVQMPLFTRRISRRPPLALPVFALSAFSA